MSKFDKLFEARGVKATPKRSSAKKGRAAKGGPAGERGEVESAAGLDHRAAVDGKRRRGRPHGKRSDPDYVGFTTYIRKDTHHEVKVALLQEKKGRELSVLVEELLVDWLKSRPGQ